MKRSEVKYLKVRNDGAPIKRRAYVKAEGLVSDNFGIVKQGKLYLIIHLKSGHSFKFLHQDKAAVARGYVEKLENLGLNWDAESREKLAEVNEMTLEQIFEKVVTVV